MLIFVGALLAAGLLTNGVLIDSAWAGPLRPGRPAGVHQARMTAGHTAILIGTGAVIMAAVGFLISGTTSAVDSQIIKSQNSVVAPPVSTVVFTSTTTT